LANRETRAAKILMKNKDKKLPDGSDKRDFSALSALYINCILN